MKGCRPLTREEEARLLATLQGRMGTRNRAMVIMGTNLGFRASSLLSLNLGDVLAPDGRLVDEVTVHRRYMKGKRHSHSIPLNAAAKAALLPWIRELRNLGGVLRTTPLFCTSTLRRLDRRQAYSVIRRAAETAGVGGRIGTHSLRKAFAVRLYNHLLVRVAAGDPIDAFRTTSRALGHTSVASTDHYLEFMNEPLVTGVLAIGNGASLPSPSGPGF